VSQTRLLRNYIVHVLIFLIDIAIMARSAKVHGGQDSQKENIPGPAKVKMEKNTSMKGKRVARRNTEEELEVDEMQESDGGGDSRAPNGTGNGETEERHQVEEDEDEGEGEDSVHSPKGHKRVRLSVDGESIPVKKESAVKGKIRVATLPRDDDGSVVPSW
jgi:structural maintenance of chromosomes protein 5